jgi:hypothetical protein
MPDEKGLSLSLPPELLRPLVREVVHEALTQLEQARARLPEDKLAFGECEAASLLSLAPHQLRDERLRGNVKASVGPGRKILYDRNELLAYLSRRPWQPPRR